MVELLARLPFPLNIYALVLFWEHGAVEHLHYGHYEQPGEATDMAQAHAVSLLLAHLPQSGKLLEVGCGFGGLTARLLKQGYLVTGITPDAAQIETAQSLHGGGLPLCCSSLEEFRDGEGTWDALVFHESGQYVPMLDLFDRASALLKPEGELIVLDEFALQRTTPGTENLHLKRHFLALAQRFGFVCRTDIDCSAAAAPSLDFLEHALQKYRLELLAATTAAPDALDALVQSNRNYRVKYRDGRFGYHLLRLQREKQPVRCLRQIHEADQPAVNQLFSTVFGQTITPEFWRWKYGNGRGDAVGLWQDGQLIAHYGGMLRHIYCDGVMETASQSCDVMVAPSARGGLSRKGPLLLTSATYLEQFVGYGRPCLLAYGFPNDRAYRLPYKLGLYSQPVTQVNELSWKASTSPYRLWGTRPLDMENPEHATIVDNLWETMLQEMGSLAIGIRNAAYWTHRYQHHPLHTYRLLLVRHRFWHTPLAALVVKHDVGRLELLDWVGPIKHSARIIAAGCQCAAESGAGELYLWGSTPVADSLSVTCPQIKDLNVQVPTNAWTDGPPISVLEGRLWLTGGDTDFR